MNLIFCRSSRSRSLVYGVLFYTAMIQICLAVCFWIYTTDISRASRYTTPANLFLRYTPGKIKTVQWHSSYGHCQRTEDDSHQNVGKNNHIYFRNEFKIMNEPLISWINNSKSFCKRRLTVYSDKFGIAHDIVINPTLVKGFGTLAKGGERVEEIPLQTLQKEIYRLKPGFFEIRCNDTAAFEKFVNVNSFERLKSITFSNDNEGSVESGLNNVDKFTIGIERGDYANLWNHMFEVYGVFLMMMAFKKQPDQVQVMVMDGHPSCNLDRNWETLFGPLVRAGRLSEPTLFSNFIFGLKENTIPLSKWENPSCPYVEEFRTFILNQYGLTTIRNQLQCDRLTFTVIFRRNQVYHPRNMQGNVERKILNELDIIETLMDVFPGVCIQALLMESIPMKAQLEIISETDVLIGMHGAGFMHSTFLPKHAGLVELFPYKYRDTRRHTVMYERMAKWRGLKYVRWISDKANSLIDERTSIVNATEIADKVKEQVNMIC